MSYAVEIKRTCDSCTRLATHRVFAYGNQPMGKFCKKHANERVKALDAAEKVNPEGWGPRR